MGIKRSPKEDARSSGCDCILPFARRLGSEDPQLCVRYTMRDANDPDGPKLHIYQRFIFNLNWSPDNFSENESSVESLVASGEIDFF